MNLVPSLGPRGSTLSTIPSQNRQKWLRTLSQTNLSELTKVWADLQLNIEFAWLREPETGTVMVRGRIAGDGQAFNLAEATVSRATVRIADGTIGFGYTLGRDHHKARLIALFDAAFQRDPNLQDQVIHRLEAAIAEQRRKTSIKAAATKVDFFTMVRGEDPK
jgi:alpha-D-ribose 1-methylphosphonate 5-triphosphate synthase subunit PhnG